MPQRSAAATAFVRLLDDKRKTRDRLTSKRGRIATPRVEIAQPPPSPFHEIPRDMPIDFFDPSFFNELDTDLRREVALRKIALLGDVSQSLSKTSAATERLNDEDFTALQGPDVFHHYEMVEPYQYKKQGKRPARPSKRKRKGQSSSRSTKTTRRDHSSTPSNAQSDNSSDGDNEADDELYETDI
jgi:hypothetical protein